MVEPQGAETIVHGMAGNAPVTVRLPGAHRVRPRETLPLAARPEHLHLFDAAHGRRLG